MAVPFVFLVYSLLLAQSPADRDPQASWPAEFYAGTMGSHFSQGSSYAGWQGSASASATLYLGRRLLDDGTPLAMQGYLQRLSRLSLSCGGGALAGRDSASPYRYDSTSMHVSPAGFFYLGGMVVGAGAYYYRLGSNTQPTNGGAEQHHTIDLFYPWATAGLRVEDFEAYGSYQYRTYYDDGARRPSRWGRASVRLRNIVDNTFAWRLDVYTITGGGGGAFSVEAFAERTLGVWFEGYMETGQIYVNSTNEYSRPGAEIGVGWWVSPSFELQFAVGGSTASRTEGNYSATTTVSTTLGVVLRAPRHDSAKTPSEPEPPPSLLVAPPSASPVPLSPVPVMPEEVPSPAQPSTPAEPSAPVPLSPDQGPAAAPPGQD